jgi:hypothetical protein
VIVPYELIALAATGTGSFSRTDASAGAEMLADIAIDPWMQFGSQQLGDIEVVTGFGAAKACRPRSLINMNLSE